MKKIGALLLLLLFVGGSVFLYRFLQQYLDREKAAVKEEVIEEEKKLEEEEKEKPDLEDFLPAFTQELDDVPPPVMDLFNATLAEAQNEASMDRWPHSKALLRQAIDMTSNATLRAIAGQEMGNVLLQEARVNPWPNALAAEFYLEGALEIEKEPYRRERAEKMLEETRKMIVTGDLKELPETGSRFQMEKALEDAKPYMTSQAEQMEYKLREANMIQQTAQNPTWFNEYASQKPEVADDPEAARKQLRQEAIERHLWIAQNSRGAVRDEAYFRAAQLLVAEKQFTRADQVIQSFLNNEPLVFIPETMLLLAQIATDAGDARKAASLLMQSIQRFGLTRESQEQITTVVDKLAEEQFFKEASETLTQLAAIPSLSNYSADMLVRAKLLEAQHFEHIKEPDRAEEIYSQIVMGDYPPTVKQAAISKLFESQLKKHRSGLGMLLIGIQAVEADPDNEYAKTILVQMAQTIEQLGLPHYAQEIYEKIALLGVADDQQGTVRKGTMSLEAATLGTARCHYKAGNAIRADYLLRNICNNYDDGPIKSEAAFWWAQIAFNNEQLQESSRRLSLMDLSILPPEFTAKARVLDQFINMRLGISNAEIIESVLKELAALPAGEREFLREYYPVFFDIWDRRNDLNAMIKWYRGCMASPHRGLIPVESFFFRIANRVMASDGLAGALAFVNAQSDLLAPEERERLLNELWTSYLPIIRQIGLSNRALGMAITEAHRKQRGR